MSISDRHMRPIPGLTDATETQPLTVRIQMSDAMAQSVAGQLTLSSLMNLLSRLVGSVGLIQLDIPDAKLQSPLPCEPVAGNLLAAALRIAEWSTGCAVKAEAWDGEKSADFAILIGAQGRSAPARHQLSCQGVGWRAWIGSPASVAHLDPIDLSDANPLGPFLAAALAASEVFKCARKAERGSLLSAFSYSLWSGESADEFRAVADGPSLSNVELPPFYIVGAGAVGQGLAYVLGSAPISGSVVVIDNDNHDDTNLNRCFLAGAQDEGDPKIKCVERFLSRTPIGVAAFPQTLIDYVGSSHQQLQRALVEAEHDGRFELIVSCVDKGASRQAIQGLWPRLIFGGSTEGFAAKTNLYDLEAGTACLGCHNPSEPDGEKIRLLERQMRHLDRARRAAFLADKVEDLEAVLNYLERDQHECGSVGESQFRAAAVRHGGEFSVGFVSLGASLLLASAIFRRLAFEGADIPRSTMATLNFLHARAADSLLAVNSNCDRCRGGVGSTFEELWGDIAPRD